jgi:hypothetical protein
MTDIIVSSLQNWNVNLKNLRGQEFDVASNFSKMLKTKRRLDCFSLAPGTTICLVCVKLGGLQELIQSPAYLVTTNKILKQSQRNQMDKLHQMLTHIY